MKKFLILSFLIILPAALSAHGTVYQILSDHTLKIEAKFDTGEPISRAPVLVFPPGETEAAYKLQTDDQGIFYFTPDSKGTWILQVRGKEGHGLRINLPIDASMTAKPFKTSGLTLPQKLLAALCVIWGAAGTALYFRRKK